MKTKYLSIFLSLALVFGVFSVALAHDGLPDDSSNDVDHGPRMMGVLETQREEMRTEFETRRMEAKKMGDEMRMRQEEARLEFETKRAEIDAEREAKRAQFEAKREEMQAKRVAFQQENAQRKVVRTTEVMTATIERLLKIADRVDSRIVKIQEKGGDTVESLAFIAAARANLAEAQAVVDEFVGIDLTGDNAQDNYEQIRTKAAEIREIIRSAHENLMLAVRSLSAVEVDLEDENPSDGGSVEQ